MHWRAKSPWLRVPRAALARRLRERWLRAGAHVIGTATSQGGADGITEALGGKGRGIVLNVADDESVAAAIKDIQGNEGSPRSWSTTRELQETICSCA